MEVALFLTRNHSSAHLQLLAENLKLKCKAAWSPGMSRENGHHSKQLEIDISADCRCTYRNRGKESYSAL